MLRELHSDNLILEAEQPHSETWLYGANYRFRYQEGDYDDISELRIFEGGLRVGGALSETEAVEGVIIRYNVRQRMPAPPEEGYREGTFVVQTVSQALLARRAMLAIEKLNLEQMMQQLGSDES